MGAPAPSAQDFFGAGDPKAPTSALPTPEQFFAASTPQSGAAHDTIWSSVESAGARILNHVGYGFQDNWGSRPIGLDSDTEGALRKAGVINDYQQGHDTFVKSINEAIIRPAADFADLAARTPGAVLGAISGGLGQAGEEVAGTKANAVRGALAFPLKAAGEAAEEVSQGALGEAPALAEAGRVPEVAASERATEAARARSAGVVGEGEAGFYGAEPLTPENVAARADAAKDAGITPPPPLPPPPDIHALARRIDPETFEQYDALALERDQHRQTVAALGAEREASPEALEAQNQIDTILGKVHGVEDRLTNAARARLAEAQDRLDTALNAETPEMAAARNALMEADFKMRDLAPEVSAAYRSAQEIAPNIPEVAEPVKAPGEGGGAEEPAKEGEPQAPPAIATGAEVEAEGAPQPVPAVAAGEAGAEAEVAPPSVTGGEKLGAGEGLDSGKIVSFPVKAGAMGLPDGQSLYVRKVGENKYEWQLGDEGKYGDGEGALGGGIVGAHVSRGTLGNIFKDLGIEDAGREKAPVDEGVAAERAGAGTQAAEGAQPAPTATGATQEPVPTSRFRQAATDVDEHRSPRPARSNILQAIKDLGGLKLKNEDGSATPVPDVQGAMQDFKRKPPGVVNNAKGLTPERMHEALAERGWFGQGDIGPEALVDALRSQAGGRDVFHPESGLAEAHARRAVLDHEMTEAGVLPTDDRAVAAEKLSQWRQTEIDAAGKMEGLRARADELGVSHDAATTYDELLGDVLEREAIQGDLTGHELDSYERDVYEQLTDADLSELDRLATEGPHPERGAGEAAFPIPEPGEPLARAAEGGVQPSEGAAGNREGAAELGGAGARTGELAAIEGGGDLQTRGLSEGVEAKAIEDGLTSTFGDLPEYRQLSMADQAAKAQALIDSDYETAKAIALGDAPAPEGLLPESVFVGVEKRALAEGDVDTLRQLATRSRLTTAATTMGQRIWTLGERDPSSPVGAILEVQKAREADLAKRMDIAAATRDTVSEIRDEMHAAASKVDAWRDFIAQISCDEG